MPFRHRQDSVVSFLQEVQDELNEAMYRKDTDEAFITYASLEVVWTETRFKTLVDRVHPGFGQDMIHFVRDNLLRTISILVYIGWDDWGSFGKHFLHHRDDRGAQDRLDKRIPLYTPQTLDFLDRADVRSFLSDRWAFIPAVLKQGEYHRLEKDRRLPFVNPPTPIGCGGYGQVSEEVVAYRHFEVGSKPHQAPYPHEMHVARKRFANWRHFNREVEVLEVLRSCQSQNDRILYSLAIVEVGDHYNILAPVARMDLERFLAGEWRDSSVLTLKNLLGETRKVMGGLDFLHGKLQSDQPGVACCHNDLKPANILVFYEDGSSPVGIWKISDFGISIIDQPDEPRLTTNVTDAMEIPTFHREPVRNPGTYQAPEVCYDGNTIGRKSDVWSMGCILIRIFVLAIDGPSALQELDWKRSQFAPGELDCEHDYFHRGPPEHTYLNPAIEQWIKGLPARSSTEQDTRFWNKIEGLLLSMLSINRSTRPSAEAVVEDLHLIEKLIPHRLLTPPPQPSPPTSAPSPVPVNSSPSTRSTSATSQGSVLVECLVKAIHSGQHDGILSILGTGVDVEEPYMEKRPLLYAIECRASQAVQTILGYKKDLDLKKQDSKGQTPLALAASLGDADMVNLLVRAGAPVDQRSAAGKTALMKATWNGHYHVAKLLLHHGADWRLCSDDQWTVLHHAIHGSGGGEMTSLFIDQVNFDVDTPTEQDRETPLLMLIKNYGRPDFDRWWDKFNILLGANADVNKTDLENNSPLSYAVDNDIYEPAKCLKNKHGALVPPDIDFSQLSSSMSKLLDPEGKRRSPTFKFPSFRKSGSKSKR